MHACISFKLNVFILLNKATPLRHFLQAYSQEVLDIFCMRAKLKLSHKSHALLEIFIQNKRL